MSSSGGRDLKLSHNRLTLNKPYAIFTCTLYFALYKFRSAVVLQLCNRTVYQHPCHSREQPVEGRLVGTVEGSTAAGNGLHIAQNHLSGEGSQGRH